MQTELEVFMSCPNAKYVVNKSYPFRNMLLKGIILKNKMFFKCNHVPYR